VDYLIDTNVLLRSLHRNDPASRTAREALITLIQDGRTLCVTLQNAAEFWVVCTRPKGGHSNGLGLAAHNVERYFSRFEPFFAIVPETTDVYATWKRLVTTYNVSGLKAHDTRLVAVMLTHGVESILTFNVPDFRRYPGITVVHPAEILPL
jgi:predicted nucleic acid-binding protein